MRFDDRLNTVLAQPASNEHDRAVRWRQLVELLARAVDDLSSPIAQQALSDIRSEAGAIDPQIRAAAARAIARPQLPTKLVAAFASDMIFVSAPVLTAVSLTPVQWSIVLDDASPESARLIRSLYPEINEWPGQQFATQAVDAEIEEIDEAEAEQPQVVAEAEAEAEPEVEFEAEPEPEPEPEPALVPEPEPEPAPIPQPDLEPQPQFTPVAAAPSTPPPVAPPPPPPFTTAAPPSASAAPIPSISEVLARIETLRQDRQFPRPLAEAAGVTTRERPRERRSELPASLFRWECGPSGEIAWVEGVARGPLIGRSLSAPGEHNGVDQKVQRAFGVRSPFRDARLTVGGEGPASGEWKMSGVPAFDPSDGRFAGYRGVAVRSGETDQDDPLAEPRDRIDENSLRELVHELKTPLNAIIGFAEIIDGQYLGPAAQTYRERAAEIVLQARLLLSAIEDLDVTAQLRAAGSSNGDWATDLNGLLSALGPDFRDRATRRGAAFEPVTSRVPAICPLDRNVLERLLRRFISSVIDIAEPKEKVTATIDCDVGQCLLSVTRPKAMQALSDAQLFGRSDASEDVLASGFSLKLARGIAQTAGGDLRTTGDRLSLVLPRRS